jgi:hypothetical protein
LNMGTSIRAPSPRSSASQQVRRCLGRARSLRSSPSAGKLRTWRRGAVMCTASKPPGKAMYVAPRPDWDWLRIEQRKLYTRSEQQVDYVFCYAHALPPIAMLTIAGIVIIIIRIRLIEHLRPAPDLDQLRHRALRPASRGARRQPPPGSRSGRDARISSISARRPDISRGKVTGAATQRVSWPAMLLARAEPPISRRRRSARRCPGGGPSRCCRSGSVSARSAG